MGLQWHGSRGRQSVFESDGGLSIVNYFMAIYYRGFIAGRRDCEMQEDFYLILGVSRDAPLQEIKRKYRKLARELHPDVNPSKEAEKRFKKITEAFGTLSDTEKRREHDQKLFSQEAQGPSHKKPPHNVNSVPLWQVASWPWHHGVAEGDVSITRIPVADEKEAWERMRILEELGMQPVRHESKFLGPTVRISGEDVEKVDQARQELARAAQWPWQSAITNDNEPIMRVPVSDPGQAQAMMNALEKLGMMPYLHHSRVLGQTVRVMGEDMQGIRAEQQRQAFMQDAVSDIVKWGWKSVENGPFHSFEVGVKNKAEAQAKIKSMRAAGMDGEISFIEGEGMSVRLTGGRDKFLPAWVQFAASNNPFSNPPPSGRQSHRPRR
jgi:hypothetical protein